MLSAKFTELGFQLEESVLSGVTKSNRKHSAGSFQKNERSEAHVIALVAFTTSQQGNDTASLLSEAFKTSKIKERAAMTVIFESCRFLARQGLLFRRHLQNSGNATELLKLFGRFDSSIAEWICQSSTQDSSKYTWTNWDTQNNV